jgi:zinc transport system substrate-binding protein
MGSLRAMSTESTIKIIVSLRKNKYKVEGESLKRNQVLVIGLMIFSLTIALLGACTTIETNKLRVVTGTSLVTCIVQQVGGNHIETINLVPPNQHPGNFDVKPEDIQKLATAQLFLLQDLPGETYVDKLVAAANNPNLKVVKASVNGNWMIPSVQSAATDKVLAILSEIDPENATAYQKAADAYKKRIQAKETEIKNKLNAANVSKISVIASARQADFLQWAGFNVIATFVSAQSLTPQVVKDLVDKGKAADVPLVVNNLQDGQDAGKAIAEELNADNVNLSNFPGGFSSTATWEKAIDYNVTLLINAIR